MTSLTTAASRNLAHSLHLHLDHSGGFTLHNLTLEPMREGVSVCADPAATMRVAWPDWDHNRVASWIRHHAGRLVHNDLHLGGWLDRDANEVWLDLVRVYPESHRHQALLTGLRHQQHSVFDIGARTLLCLAGVTAASAEAVALTNALKTTG